MNRLPIISPEQIYTCNDIAIKTYATFNSIINPSIIAGGLVLNPYYSGADTYLAYTNRRVVFLYPYNIILCFEDPQILKFTTAYTVLHELSHFEQDIDFDRYETDLEYQDQIEVANDTRTMNFVLNNIDTFGKIIGVDSREAALSLCESIFSNCRSEEFHFIGIRKYYHEIIVRYLNALSGMLEDLNNLINNIDLIDTYKIIQFDITDQRTGERQIVYIKKDGVFVNTGPMNNAIYNLLERYNKWDLDTTVTIGQGELYATLINKNSIITPFDHNIDK